MKAEGGWGVVSMQITEIGPDSDMANHPMDRMWDEGDVAMHARQAALIHEHGALAAIEIAHNASLLQDDIIDRADSRRSVSVPLA